MVRIKIIEDCAVRGEHLAAGTVITTDDQTAGDLLTGGRAVPAADEPAPAPAAEPAKTKK